MKNKKSLKNRPLHPFRFLASGTVTPQKTDPQVLALKAQSAAEQKIISMLSSGARVLFDIKQKRALIYSFRRGFQSLCEITVRTLSSLVAQGKLIMVGREGRMVHYALPGSVNPSWFAPE